MLALPLTAANRFLFSEGQERGRLRPRVNGKPSSDPDWHVHFAVRRIHFQQTTLTPDPELIPIAHRLAISEINLEQLLALNCRARLVRQMRHDLSGCSVDHVAG